jgi:glutathione synthase/RimK-type ligase-like ATP-grasp enzyme
MNYRKQIKILLAILLFPLVTLAASGFDIRFNPKDYVYICEVNVDREWIL